MVCYVGALTRFVVWQIVWLKFTNNTNNCNWKLQIQTTNFMFHSMTWILILISFIFRFGFTSENTKKHCDSSAIKIRIRFTDQKIHHQKTMHRRFHPKQHKNLHRRHHHPAKTQQTNRLPQRQHRVMCKAIPAWIVRPRPCLHDLHTIRVRQVLNMLVQCRPTYQRHRLHQMAHASRLVALPPLSQTERRRPRHRQPFHWSHHIEMISQFKKSHRREIVRQSSTIISKWLVQQMEMFQFPADWVWPRPHPQPKSIMRILNRIVQPTNPTQWIAQMDLQQRIYLVHQKSTEAPKWPHRKAQGWHRFPSLFALQCYRLSKTECKFSLNCICRSVTWSRESPAEKLSFTMRREFDRQKEESELIENLRKAIESRLKMTLPKDVASALIDGVVLCHLANHVRPRSVGSIHVPSPAVVRISCCQKIQFYRSAFHW